MIDVLGISATRTYHPSDVTLCVIPMEVAKRIGLPNTDQYYNHESPLTLYFVKGHLSLSQFLALREYLDDALLVRCVRPYRTWNLSDRWDGDAASYGDDYQQFRFSSQSDIERLTEKYHEYFSAE